MTAPDFCLAVTQIPELDVDGYPAAFALHEGDKNNATDHIDQTSCSDSASGPCVA
jgi:hypothetical protein